MWELGDTREEEIEGEKDGEWVGEWVE